MTGKEAVLYLSTATSGDGNHGEPNVAVPFGGEEPMRLQSAWVSNSFKPSIDLYWPE